MKYIFGAAIILRKWTSSNSTLRFVSDKEGEGLDRLLRQERRNKVLVMKRKLREDQTTFPSMAWRPEIDVIEITKRQLS